MSLSKFREFTMDREVWRAAVHGVTKSRTRLSDWTELIYNIELVRCTTSDFFLYRFLQDIDYSFCVCTQLLSCVWLWPHGQIPPGSSFHGILQVRILVWIAISSSRRSSWSRDQTCISCIGRWVPYHWATWGPNPIPILYGKSLFVYSIYSRASLVAQRLKRLPAMRETWVRSLGRDDPLEKEIAIIHIYICF